MKKAAVTIGVNKVQDNSLVELKSAASGAKYIAEWLKNEGYDVKCFADSENLVTARDVYDAILSFTDLPVKYDLLLVYFSGHGYWISRSDYWLLSGAPKNPNECINLASSIDLAKYSGIPNIVFISDTCRSIPLNRSGQLLNGSTAFPNHPEINTPSKIDFFKATSESRPAYEILLNGRYISVLTDAFIAAYKHPNKDMIKIIDTNTGIINVVPNRKLDGFLQDEVNRILLRAEVSKTQRIEVNVPSDDDTYISRVHFERRSSTRRLNNHNFDQFNDLPCFTKNQHRSTHFLGDLFPRLHPHVNSLSGFVIHGAEVDYITLTSSISGYIPEIKKLNAKLQAELISIDTSLISSHPVSVLIVLKDGRSVILPLIKEYIGYTSFDDSGLTNIFYTPSIHSQRWQSVKHKILDLNTTRKEVIKVTAQDSFPILASELVQKISEGKTIDPMMGLYEAMFFYQISRQDKVEVVSINMNNDLGFDLFDIRLLESRTRYQFETKSYPLLPQCPMLTQNWHLLLTRGIQMPKPFQQARKYLSNSLWTTFERDGTAILTKAFKSGDLK